MSFSSAELRCEVLLLWMKRNCTFAFRFDCGPKGASYKFSILWSSRFRIFPSLGMTRLEISTSHINDPGNGWTPQMVILHRIWSFPFSLLKLRRSRRWMAEGEDFSFWARPLLLYWLWVCREFRGNYFDHRAFRTAKSFLFPGIFSILAARISQLKCVMSALIKLFNRIIIYSHKIPFHSSSPCSQHSHSWQAKGKGGTWSLPVPDAELAWWTGRCRDRWNQPKWVGPLGRWCLASWSCRCLILSRCLHRGHILLHWYRAWGGD